MQWSKWNIVDVECTCEEVQDANYARDIQEIIEIGIVTVDTKTLTIVGEASLLVEPFGEISDFCTKLTTLTLKQIQEEGGQRFHAACMDLQMMFLSDQRPWASWGDFDRRAFERQCKREHLPTPFADTHTNLRALFAAWRGHSQRLDMPGALNSLGLTLEGTHHRGIDDARNIARIFIEMLRAGRTPNGGR